jgi:acetyl-CoA C-acetyltransferase
VFFSIIVNQINQMNQVYILSAKRTPLGSFGGALSSISATDLGATAIKEAIGASGLSNEDVNEVLMGHVVQANAGQSPAKQAMLKAGLPSSVSATTINKVCASGMKSIAFGAQSIQLGQQSVVVAGGMENMSSIPFYIPKGRYGYGYGNAELVDGLVRDGLQNVYDGQPMGCFADATATKHEITREEQDAYAIQSYQRSAAAWAESSALKSKIARGISISSITTRSTKM